MERFVRLVLWTNEWGNHSTISCLRATAEFYGWTKHYVELNSIPDFVVNGRGYGYWRRGIRGLSGEIGGHPLRICRSSSKMGHPAGHTNTLRINKRVSVYDLAELAHFTEGDWHWLEDKSGKRVSREHWEEIYQSGARSTKHLPEAPRWAGAYRDRLGLAGQPLAAV